MRFSAWNKQNGAAVTGLVLLVVIITVGLLAYLTVHQVSQNQSQQNPAKTSGSNLSLADFNLHIQDILAVNVSYNQTLAQGFAILTVAKKKGFLKKPIPHRLHYTLQLLDDTGLVIASQSFVPADEVEEDSIAIAGKVNAQTKFSHTVSFTLQIPWQNGGTSLRIMSPSGVPMLTRPLKPNEITGSFNGLPSTIQTNLAALSGKLAVQAKADSGHKLTIVFVPEGYGDMEKDKQAQTQFQQDVATYINAAKQFEPYKTRWDKDFTSILLDTTNVSFCDELRAGQRTSDAIENNCSFAPIYDKLANMNIVPDVTVVVANWPEMKDFSFAKPEESNVVLSNQIAKQYPTMLAHELGHAIGKLFDETGSTTSDIQNNQMYENCFAGSSPNWHGLDAFPKNTAGCAFSNWQASSAQSLMNNISTGSKFNPVSLYFMNAWIDYYTDKAASPVLAQPRVDLPIRIENHSGGLANFCPTQEAIDDNRKTTPETCIYLHPRVDIHNTNITSDQLATFASLYKDTFVNGHAGTAADFDRNVQYIVDHAKQANLNPVFALALWRSESAFSTAKVTNPLVRDLGCSTTSDAPNFMTQVLCLFGLKDTTLGPKVDYTNPKAYPVPDCANGDNTGCQQLLAIRTAKTIDTAGGFSLPNFEIYQNDPIDYPIQNFDDFLEAYGPKSPLLSAGGANYNCVHSYNDAVEVVTQLHQCSANAGSGQYYNYDEPDPGQTSPVATPTPTLTPTPTPTPITRNCPASSQNTICGFVKNASGTGVGNVTVGYNCLSPCTAANTTTASDGYFEFINLAATTYEIGIGPAIGVTLPAGYTSASSPVTIAIPTANNRVNITIQ